MMLRKIFGRTGILILCVGFAFNLMLSFSVFADEFPSKPIQLIIPFAPGHSWQGIAHGPRYPCLSDIPRRRVQPGLFDTGCYCRGDEHCDHTPPHYLPGSWIVSTAPNKISERLFQAPVCRKIRSMRTIPLIGC